ncbi:MAG: choice-of-anchor B family protein, partial [Bacteroidota bacterium]
MRHLLLALLLATSFTAFGQLNATLRSNFDYTDGVNDIWGYVAPDGPEYAIVGLETGVSFVSLADPDNPFEVTRINGDFSQWRDMKTYGEYAYSVADEGTEGITAFDLSDLPNDVTFNRTTYQVPGFERVFARAHNIYIDEEKGIAYTAGGTRNVNDGGILMFDLNQDPMSPVLIGVGPSVYSHDVFTKGDTMYCSQIFRGNLAVYDISDYDNIVELGATFTPLTFTHNAWTTDDAQTIFTTDERRNAPVAAYDLSDKNDIKLLDEFRPLATINTGVIPHNVHVINDFLSISYYSDGLVVADASKPDNIIEVANWDTYLGDPNVEQGFVGAWGAMPFLPSGLTLVSDRQTGLYVVDINYVRAARLEGVITDG